MLSVVMIFFMETFDRILSFTMFLDCIGMAFSAATLFILRRRQKDVLTENTYRMRLYPWLPLLFIAAYGFVAYSIALNKPVTALTAVAVLAAFVIIYFVFRRSPKHPAGMPGPNL
jgi:APA family basic amino acid/polyamine antiporter